MRRLGVLLTFIFLIYCFHYSIASTISTVRIPILTYHNFDPKLPGSMTVSPAQFEEQLKWLKDNGYTVIALKELVEYLRGKRPSIPTKAVVITADDGRKSQYIYMLPLAKKYNVPVTLFIYPTSISNASYALTWEQISEMQKTGLFDVQCHTYWHPNFIQEKKHLSAAAYEQLVHVQLINSKKKLEEKLGTKITLLAWPYGIYDRYLEKEAAKAGYDMAFSIDDRCACRSERLMSQPRWMVRATESIKTFSAHVSPKS